MKRPYVFVIKLHGFHHCLLCCGVQHAQDFVRDATDPASPLHSSTSTMGDIAIELTDSDDLDITEHVRRDLSTTEYIDSKQQVHKDEQR